MSYIYQTVDLSDFRNAFRAWNREDSFTYEGLGLIFDHLESIAEDTGEPLELDVIAICCDYNETNLETINQDYGQEFETLDDAVDWLNDETVVVGQTSETIVFAVF